MSPPTPGGGTPLGFSPPFFLSVSFLIFSLDRFAIACLLKHLRGYNAHSTASTIPNAREANMGLQIAARKAGNVTILDLRGRITIGVSNDTLGAELRRLAETPPCDVLVNLEGVQQVDSSGISTLVRSFVTLERNAGSLKLLNPTGHVREVLELTRLIQSIPTYTDEAKAVSSFRGGVARA
jgi:anti-sigma B factor antagonist